MNGGGFALLGMYTIYFCIVFGPFCLGCVLLPYAIWYSEKQKKKSAEEKAKKRLEESANVEMIDQPS